MKNDEILIRVRDTMSDKELLLEMQKVATALHGLFAGAINGGLRGHMTAFVHLTNACSAAESCCVVMQLPEDPRQQGPLIHRPM